jgi:hypothetical protein
MCPTIRFTVSLRGFSFYTVRTRQSLRGSSMLYVLSGRKVTCHSNQRQLQSKIMINEEGDPLIADFGFSRVSVPVKILS